MGIIENGALAVAPASTSHFSQPSLLRSPDDLKPPRSIKRGDRMRFHALDVPFEFAFSDPLKETFHFLEFALGLQFDTSVWKIPYPAGHIVATGDLFDCEAETDALDAALVIDLAGNHGVSGLEIGNLRLKVEGTQVVSRHFRPHAVDPAASRQFEASQMSQPGQNLDVPAEI